MLGVFFLAYFSVENVRPILLGGGEKGRSVQWLISSSVCVCSLPDLTTEIVIVINPFSFQVYVVIRYIVWELL